VDIQTGHRLGSGQSLGPEALRNGLRSHGFVLLK
jgi:hypothetical protein